MPRARGTNVNPRRHPRRPDGAAGSLSARAADPTEAGPPDAGTVDFRTVFDLAPDPILLFDSEGHYVDANHAAERVTGYSRDEIVRMRIGDLTVPESRSESQDRLALLRQVGQTRKDRILLRKDGTTLPVEGHAVRIAPDRFCAVIRDISDRVEAHGKLLESLGDYSTLVDLCRAAVVSADEGDRVLTWNPAAQELFGYSPEEAIGMPVAHLIPAGSRERHTEAFRRRASDSGSSFGRTLNDQLALRKDGVQIPVELSIAVGRRGDRTTFTAVIRDTSEQTRAVSELNDALRILRFHMERMPLAYILWDADFRVTQWNPAAERIFGYSRDEALGRGAWELIVPKEAHDAVKQVWRELLDGSTSSHSINRNVRKDGTLLTCEWFNTSLMDSQGVVRSVASMAMDITDREYMEARLRDAQKLESLGVLAGGIAHDFNSSLMVMLGNATLLRSATTLPPRAREHLDLIEEAGTRASQLIRHLLTYARTGRHNPQLADLNSVIRDASTFLRSSLGKQHEIVMELAGELPLIRADRSQVEQVLVNLCQNARQAMPSGGAIRVSTCLTTLSREEASRCIPYDTSPGRYVELAVHDDGCGMDQATAQRIFDPFFTTKPDGHGLGLAAVLGILRQHRGAALVESVPGQGTNFRVFFPVEITGIGRQSSATVTPPRGGNSGWRTQAPTQSALGRTHRPRKPRPPG